MLNHAKLVSRDVFMLPDGRMNTANAARYTGYAAKTLAMWRTSGTGPRFIKVAGRVFYYKEDLDRWLNEGGRQSSTAQARQAVRVELVAGQGATLGIGPSSGNGAGR